MPKRPKKKSKLPRPKTERAKFQERSAVAAQKLDACNACGNPQPNRLAICQRCGSTKCDACDMGDEDN